jgi:hypothetical protein
MKTGGRPVPAGPLDPTKQKIVSIDTVPRRNHFVFCLRNLVAVYMARSFLTSFAILHVA